MTATAEKATPQTAAEARAARLEKKNGKAPAPVAKATRAITPAPKGTPAKATRAKVKPEGGPDPAEIRRQEAEGKRLAKEAADAERQKARDAKAEAKKAKDSEREKARQEREAAKAERQKATARTLDWSLDDHPSENTTVLLDRLNTLPEMVGALPSAAFIRDVKRHGVTTPVLLVRRTVEDANLRIAAGRRRIRASVLSGRAEVPARIFTVGDLVDEIVASFTISDNVNRDDNVAADVQMIKFLRDVKGMPLERIAKEVGIPFGTVKKRARLLDLLPEVEALLMSGAVPHTVITEMSGLSEDDQRALLKVFAENQKITHRDIKALRNAGKAEAADDLDFDALMDGPAGTGASAPIRNTGNLADDLVSFMEGVAKASGIVFNLSDTGELTFDRDGQRIVFRAMAGATPPAPEAEDEGGPQDPADFDPA